MIRATAALVLFFFVQTVFAEEVDPCAVLLSGSKDQVYRAFFKSYQENYSDGLAQRGFLGSAVPKTPQTDLMALEHGIIWWGMRFNLVPSIHDAISHRRQAYEHHFNKKTLYTDVLVAGLYIIGHESELGLTFDSEGPGKTFKPIPPNKVEMILKRGAYEVQPDGSYQFIEPARLLRRVSLEGMNYFNTAHLPASGGLNALTQAGWVAFKQHGLHDYSKWKQTDAAKRLKKLARKLVEQGYTIRFNTDYKLMLDKLRDQKRTYRAEKKDDNETPNRVESNPDHNRYRDEVIYNTALANLLAGKGYSVGVYDPKGELIAGEIGWRVGNHVYGDSVFYGDDVNLAKVAALALMEVMDAGGQPYTDPGMITAYTGSMGAELVPFPEYIDKIKSGPSELIPFPTEWNPLDKDYLSSKLQELSKRRNQGVTPRLALSRLPTPTKEALELAPEFGLERHNLNIVVVRDFAKISEHAAKVADPAEMPIYILARPLSVLDLSATEQLEDLLSFEDTTAYTVNHPKFANDVRPLDLRRLKDLLSLEIKTDQPVWRSIRSDYLQISVGVWAARRK